LIHIGLEVKPEFGVQDRELGYIAGFIDGEGTIGIIQERKKGDERHRYRRPFVYHVYVSISNNNPHILRWIETKLGVKAYYKGPRCNCRNWQIRWMCHKAYCIVKMLFPYLIVKKSQAELIIMAYDNGLFARGGAARWDPDYGWRQNVLHAEMKLLNTEWGRKEE